ncbi:hypothetical protein BEN47_00545 [Hymenobacter lapidarius]|uniref:Uncharacterized protein n=1 Tax=Hymenobacter lapidarius TaxID=1908237 RepID=A0A1G1T9Z5_9BACT|nr:hypothetical protein BEN47_00545 [Hymenobacter lapidarius]
MLVEVGWLRLSILLPMLVLSVGRGMVVAAGHPQGKWAVPVGVALLLASAHRQRADLRFLTISAPDYRRWLAVEYLLWAVPAAVVLGLFSAWGAAGLGLFLASLVAWVPPAREALSTRHKARSLLRSEAFEWVSGLRPWGGVWLLLLGIALWQHATPLGPVVALGVWLVLITACYGQPEPITMLVLAARAPGTFLRRRLLLGTGYAAFSAAPFLWLLASGPAGVGGALAVATAWLGLVALLILTKYAFYSNAVHIRFSQALVVSVALALPGNPVYPVLLLVAVGGLLWQSQRRLRLLLGSVTEPMDKD